MNTIERNESVLICGLPESGKTTFLGALCYLMCSRELETTALRHAGLPSERAYMNRLSERWCACEHMERTRVDDEEAVTLQFLKGDRSLSITFPDLSGETWRQLWVNHQCTKAFADMSRSASALILFIHADSIKKPLSVVDAQSLAKSIDPDFIQQEPGVPESWDPSAHTPTQAILVALLQFLSKEPIGGNVTKIAVVLSAWDKINNKVLPGEFIKNELPLLYQYLNSHFDYNDWKVFGVSAQGGDLSNTRHSEKERLLSVEHPSERIVVQDGSEISHDLTKILEWTL